MKRLALAVVLIACGKHHHEHGKLDEKAASDLFDVVELHDVPPGMSDLTVDDRGTLWAIPERNHTVLELTQPKPTPHPLDGIADDMDTEAIGWLGDNHFAIGIEGGHSAVAAVAFADLDPASGHIVVKRTRTFTNAELGVEVTINHGIEGVCGHGDELLAATESVGKFADGSRWASLVRLHGDELHVTKLHLTSDQGKISALYCTMAVDGTATVLAIERHYGVAKILTFTVTRQDAEITPQVVVDLNPVLHDSLNLEGIARTADGRMVTINDNQGATAEGPTELLYFHPR